jgi:hypothetical protein
MGFYGNNTLITTSRNNPIVSTGLVLHLDSQNIVSYPNSGGTVWYDLSSNDNHATLYNGVSYDGRFFNFDGVNDYAQIPNSSSINSCLSSNFAYEIWVYLQTGGYQWGKVFSKGGYVSRTGSFNGLTHYLPGSLFWQYMPTGGGSGELFYSSPIRNTWIQLVYTRGSGIIKFYRNGTLQASAANTFNYSSNYNLRISSNSSSSMEPSQQKVGIFRQYDRELLAAEVLQNYNVSRTKFNV